MQDTQKFDAEYYRQEFGEVTGIMADILNKDPEEALKNWRQLQKLMIRCQCRMEVSAGRHAERGEYDAALQKSTTAMQMSRLMAMACAEVVRSGTATVEEVEREVDEAYDVCKEEIRLFGTVLGFDPLERLGV